MRKFKNLTKNIICLIVALFLCAIPFVPKLIETDKFAYAADTNPEIERITSVKSTFIHSPTYSVIYHNNIFFFDDYDNKLKKYNINNSNIEEDALSVESLGLIIDIDYIGEYIFVLSMTSAEQNNILNLTLIDLSNFIIEKTIILSNINSNYKNISICEINDIYLASLTPSSDDNSPVILTINKSTLEITNQCLLNIINSENSDLFYLTIIRSAGTNENDLYLVLTFSEKIYFFGTVIENVTIEETAQIDTSKSSLYGNLETTNANTEIASVNTITVNSKIMFLITYIVTDNTNKNIIDAYSKLYNYQIDVSDEYKTFISVLNFSVNGYNYITTANSFLLYPLSNEQQIVYTELSYNEEKQVYSDTTHPLIKNPNVTYDFNIESEFKYATTNKPTKLLVTTPWALNNSNNIELNSEKDVIIIGKGKISGENSTINGFEYCMITTNDKNIKGFIKTEDLTRKEIVSVENYEYKIFKVQPNTNLYSLPTTIEEYGITDTLNSRIIAKIDENSKVELVDAICRYKSNEKIMLKVKVNNKQVGYIEYDKILKPSDMMNFVITNATIKSDNTNIYLNSSDSSPIIGTLNEGYRIRINGARNTDTGYTSITFNDEYGNEFTGYILTDAISSDSWTTMQIIGCVLIAINIGLLILILKFKKKNIGCDGSKYIENEK